MECGYINARNQRVTDGGELHSQLRYHCHSMLAHLLHFLVNTIFHLLKMKTFCQKY